MELDTFFDIKKYLEDLQLEKHFNKRRLPSFKSSLFNLKKNSYNTLNSYKPKNKNILIIRNFSDSRITNTIDCKHNHNISNIKKARFKRNKKNTKSLNSILDNKNTFITSGVKLPNNNINNNVNSLSNYILNNFSKKIKKISKNYSTNENLLYENKYKKDILDSFNLLKNYRKKKELKLFEEEKCINKFIVQKKEMSVNNLILKLLNSEGNNLIKKEVKNKNNLINIKNRIETNEINFEEYKDKQKKLCRRIDNLLFEIIKKKRSLIEMEYNVEYDNKLINEEIKKFCEKINLYLIYGKFINEVLDGDTQKFENDLFPENMDNNYDLNYELISKKILKNYNFFNKINREEKLINEPQEMINKFNDIEKSIIENINLKESLKIDISEIKKSKEKNLGNLTEKKQNLTKEYNYMNDTYLKEINICKEFKEKLLEKNEYDNIILDLYYYISDILNENKILTVIPMNMKDYDEILFLNEITHMLHYVQNYVDETLKNLCFLEKNDKKNFEEALDKRKNKIKNYKQFLARQKAIKERMKKREKVDINRNKINFIERKTEEPIYNRPKKTKKKILNKKYFENIENEELLKYNDE
jgi:hypothetical protein